MPVFGTLSPVGNAQHLLDDATPGAAVAGEARFELEEVAAAAWWETELGFAAAFPDWLIFN